MAANFRHLGLGPPRPPPLPDEATVMLSDPDESGVTFDDKGAVIKIEHGDGSVTVSLDGRPIEAARPDASRQWYGNLCDDIDAGHLSMIADDLLRGIAEDLESRKEWIEDRALGIKLLGLKVEIPNLQGAADGAPVEGMSKVRHPLMLEAVLRFQANARSEFLPTDGPVKIRNDSQDDTLAKDSLANALERDFNHYLTTTAQEYYPDTDRMLFMTGFGGTGFRKVYFCPLRNRPVLESVDADDLIVNQSATDLGNAQRVTHRSMMKPSTVKRLQILEVYRDIPLGDATAPTPDALQEAEKSQQGIGQSRYRMEDREREIYECYCELDLQGFEHKINGKTTGLPLPYVVTIDVSSRTVLSVVRNFKDGEKLPKARRRFVKWPFVPGIGFYDIGLLHILGNTTNAATAAWREMLDNGMYANFPGFLMSDTGMRQNTNIFRVPPGGAAMIKTGGLPIGQSIAPIPYNTAGQAALMGLVENMVETGQRIGGTAEVQVGEGRADVPVGTVMAMIDQAIKVMNAVHKRCHAAQAEEFQLFKEVCAENAEAFIESGCFESAKDAAKFVEALKNCNLVPQADPNTSSMGQRIMKIMGVMQLQQAAPQLYDPIKVHTAALNVMGWSNPEEFFVPPAARAAPPPQLQEAQEKMANETKAADAKTVEAQAKMLEAQGSHAESIAKIQGGVHQAQPPEGSPDAGPDPLDTAQGAATIMDAQTRRMDAHTHALEARTKAKGLAVEDHNRDLDRQATEKDTLIGLAKELLKVPQGIKGADGKLTKTHAHPDNVAAKVEKISDEIGKQP